MSNVNSIIESRRDEISNEREYIKQKKSTNKIMNFFNKTCRAFFGITGALLMVGGMPGVGFAFLSTAAANHIALKNRGIEDSKKLEFLDKEEAHIQNITKNPINGSREMTAKRLKKVRELEARKEKTSSKRKWAKAGNTFSNIFQWAALTAAVCAPPISLVAGVPLALKYLCTKSKISSAEEDDKLALRLNNLNLDLELTRAKQPSPRAAAETQYEIEQGTKEKTKAPCSIEDEMLVDKYIESLDGIGEEEKAKQYIK